MPVGCYNLKNVKTAVKTNVVLLTRLMGRNTTKGHTNSMLLPKQVCGQVARWVSQASGYRCTTVYGPCLVITNRGKECLPYFLAFMILVHLKSGCLFGDNWKKKFCGGMLWFRLNQVFRQISSCQWKHSLPEVVTFVGGKELALKQIMKQMFYAKSESGDT